MVTGILASCSTNTGLMFNRLNIKICITEWHISSITFPKFFDKMILNDMVNGKLEPLFESKISPFLRKGKTGDQKKYSNEEESAISNRIYEHVIEACGVHLVFQ